MKNLKCKECGLVNPFSATVCKRCHVALIPEADPEGPQSGDAEEGEKKNDKSEPLGAWGCIQLVILFVIAIVVTGYLGIYIREFLPSGVYPMVVLIAIFLPAAAVGLALGGLVLFIINSVIKLFK